MNDEFSNVYDDRARADSYDKLEFPGTYYLAYRDLPAIFTEHVAGISLIPHAYDGETDPDLAPVRLAGKGLRVPTGPVMTNSFGFGGNNCTLVLGGPA